MHRIQVLNHGVGAVRDGLQEPGFLLPAVEALERQGVAADLALQVSQQDGDSPCAGRSARWSLMIPARVRRSVSLAVTGAVIRSPCPRYADRSGLGIRRTSDGGDGAGLHTLVPDRPTWSAFTRWGPKS